MSKKNTFKHGILIISFLACSILHTQAQDTLLHTAEQFQIIDDTHNLKLKELLIPTAIVGVSALCINNGWLVHQKENVQNLLSAQGKHKLKIDDYMQYSPIVAIYGLNTFGVRGKHSFKDRTIILSMSYATMRALVNSMKYTFKEKRPDTGTRNSFPSGHTATTFMGAEFLYQEYKDISPYIGYAGYTVAAITGYLRMYNDRHWINDVIAGACIGVMSTKFAYWLYAKCFKSVKCNESVTVSGLPYYTKDGLGMNLCIAF